MRSDSRSKNFFHACRVRPYKSPQKVSCNSSTKCWNRSLIGITLAMGCRSPFGSALACEAKANLHPLAFYTINVTSPLKRGGVSVQIQNWSELGSSRPQPFFRRREGSPAHEIKAKEVPQ